MSSTKLHPSLPAPVVHAGFSVPQSKSHVLAGVQDAYWSDDEAEDAECPLCLEEMDFSDLNFKPCVCGYQICRFCWNHIKENLNKRCPACRRIYTDEAVEFKPIATQDHKRLTQQKKQRERERKEVETLGRRHYMNVRVVQRNVVYVVGIGPRFAKEELIPTLRSNDYFGQYGKITKIVLVKRTPSGGGAPIVGLYITYHRKEDAARAIAAVDGTASPGGGREVMRASYGTTKYCMAFLRGVTCNDHSCMNLHEWGDDKDCFTKEDLTTLKHTMKATESRTRTTLSASKDDQETGLPRAASWAQKGASISTTSIHASGSTTSRQPMRRGGPPNRPSQPSRTIASSSHSISHESRSAGSRSQPERKISIKPGSQTSSRSATPASVPLSPTVAQSSADSKDVGPATKEAGTVKAEDSTPLPVTQEPEKGLEPPTPRPQSTGSVQSSVPSVPLVPPGLPVVPPGLSAPSNRPPRVSTASPQTPLLSSQSSYQMSTAARALLDDVKARRESALSTSVGVSPFPDFDRTLRTLSGGETGGFSFNLDPNLVEGSDYDILPAIEAEAAIPFHGTFLDAFPALRSPATTQHSPYAHNPSRSIYDPHAIRTPSLSSASTSANNYIGSFNPFSDTDETSVSQPRRSNDFLDDDSTRKMSRFGFARGRQGSAHLGTPPPPGGAESYPFAPASAGIASPSQSQWGSQDYNHSQPGSSTASPHLHAPQGLYQMPNRYQPYESSLSEAQLREFIQTSRQRATLNQPTINTSTSTKLMGQHFHDPAIMSASFVSPDPMNNLAYGPPPGLSFPAHRPLTEINGTVPIHDASRGANIATPPISSPSPVLSPDDFPALPESSSKRENPDTPTTRGIERTKVKKRSVTGDKAVETNTSQEKAVKSAEKVVKAEKKEQETSEAQRISPSMANEDGSPTNATSSEVPNAPRTEARPELTESMTSRPTSKDVGRGVQKYSTLAKAPRQAPSKPPSATFVPAEPVSQDPILSRRPKKNKPISTKPIKTHHKEEILLDDVSTTGSAVAETPTSSIIDPVPASVDQAQFYAPTSVNDLIQEVTTRHPELDLASHPFFDIQKINPSSKIPLEYGPLVHALSALSVGGGAFANHIPSGSIDNAVSSFQQLLETLTQTISDLLRLLPRTTWDDSASFDGVLRDMLKGDDFPDDGNDEGNTKEDEVAALTLALERRARWMEVQLSKLEELHRDINTAAVRAVLAFNDNGWDKHRFLPHAGSTLSKFDHLGLVDLGDGKHRPMTVDELEKKLVVAKEAVTFADAELREIMGKMQSVKPNTLY